MQSRMLFIITKNIFLVYFLKFILHTANGETTQDGYLLIVQNKIWSPIFSERMQMNFSKTECSGLCSVYTVDECHGFNYIPAPNPDAGQATCQLFLMDLTTTKTSNQTGASVYIRDMDASWIRTRYYDVDKKVYMFFIQGVIMFDQVSGYCQGLGGSLASLTSMTKFEFYQEALMGSWCFMGMFDTEITGVFTDAHGNTDPVEARYGDAEGYEGHCLVTWNSAELGMYRTGDHICAYTGPFICEFPRIRDWGCFEVPPKPSGAVYQNWNGKDYPIASGALVTSVCPAGSRFQTGATSYSVTCGTDGYFIRPPRPNPFCTGGDGYTETLADKTCYKIIEESIFPLEAEKYCATMGGSLLTYLPTRLQLFRDLFFPANSTNYGAHFYTGYTDLAIEGIYKDSKGNILPNCMGPMEPGGGTLENVVGFYFSRDGSSSSCYDGENLPFMRSVCKFSNC